MALETLVDTDRYPIDDPSCERYRALIEHIESELSGNGCSVVPDFFRPETVARMGAEARRLAPLAHTNDIETNAYSTLDDASLPPGHPVRLFMERSNAFVPREAIPAAAVMSQLYHCNAFQAFVADAVGVDRVFEYADPFAGLVLNVLRTGCQHPWHYDTNEFIASALVSPAEQGGLFEYCPQIRSPHDENYGAVGRVIRGEDRSPVRQLALVAGDLQLFRGRFSLHRVTRVEGDTPRLSAIFAYAERPGFIGRVERTRQLFGRVSPVHIAAESDSARRVDGLLD